MRKLSSVGEDFFEENLFFKRYKIILENPNLLIYCNFNRCFLHKQDKITFTYYYREKIGVGNEKKHFDDFATNNFRLDWKVPCQIMFYLVVLQDHILDNFSFNFKTVFEFSSLNCTFIT